MELRFDDRGLLPAIAQDADTGRVLMLAYMNREALQRTLETGEAWFYSRSRQALWRKGETSGNVLRVQEVRVDCDGDALLLLVKPSGPACHTGETSCFFRRLEERYEALSAPGPGVLEELFGVIRRRRQEMPRGSYTARLFREGTARIAQKVIEEAGETALAGALDDAERLPEETADLLYHLLVLLADRGVPPSQVWQALRRRRR